MHALRLLQTAALAAFALGASAAQAADACPNRGDLDQMYCDANKDLVADTPTDPAKLKTPSTLVFTYTPVEDPAVYEDIFKPFTKHLSECTGKRVVFYQVQSNAAEIEAMRSGRLHGRLLHRPDRLRGQHRRRRALRGQGLCRRLPGLQPDRHRQEGQPVPEADRPEGQEAGAHRALVQLRPHGAGGLVPEGLTPDKDYKVIFSGKHDQSVMGVNSGDYDAAAVASDVFKRMVERGQVKEADFRVIYRSEIPHLVLRLRA